MIPEIEKRVEEAGNASLPVHAANGSSSFISFEEKKRKVMANQEIWNVSA
jgi:hypothetical protein